MIEHRELQVMLRAVHAGADTTVLSDKVAFHDFCQRHGLPTPAILATYTDGGAVRMVVDEAAWRTDVFSKPAAGFMSHGVACWRYQAATDTYTDGKAELDFPSLHGWFSAQSRKHTLVVQPRLGNAPELARIAGNPLANCRLVTARRVDGTVVPLLAVFRMGLGQAISSDNTEVTFCAAVHLETGRLEPAVTKQAARGSFTHHPESGAPIAGMVFPRWREMRELALRAHAALPQMIFVGWDVVDTDQGPMLLEGNLIWGGNLAQMAGNLPLGLTEFPEIFLHYYKPGTTPLAEDGDHSVG